MKRFLLIVTSSVLIFASQGCKRRAAEKVDPEGHVVVENVSSESKSASELHQQMLDEMKAFDEAVDQWMADAGVQPANQQIPVEPLLPLLKGRLGSSFASGRLIDPTGNPYVILPLDPGSNVRITISPQTASKPEFKDFQWGEHAPRT